MGDTNTDEKIVETGAEDQSESSNDGGAEGEAEGADTSENENTDNGEEAGKEGAEADKASADKKPKPTPGDDEPKTRKRNIDFILERKNEKIAKLKEKTEEKDENMDEEEIAPDDAAIIDKRVAAHLKPFIEKQAKDEDAAEIASFVKDNPDFAPYQDKAAKYAAHASRAGVPIKAIFYEVAGDDLLKLGAERLKKADAAAKTTKAGGGAPNGGGSEKSVWDLTPEEFAAKQEETRRKQRE